MSNFGSYGGAAFGPSHGQITSVIAGNITTYSMTGTDAGWAARFMAYDTQDIKSVSVSFSSVSSPGTITARIETVDTGTGDPSSNLYDGNATKQFTPSGGWNNIQFDSLPTSGLIPGDMYALVLIKDNNGTTCTLNSRLAVYDSCLPAAILTTATASSRSTFAETANAAPVCYFTFEDDSIDALGGAISVTPVSTPVYTSDRVAGMKLVLNNSIIIRGVRLGAMLRTGTPAGDLRLRILNSDNSVVSGTSVTIKKDYLLNINTRSLYIPLPLTTLSAGTYRIVFDSVNSANSSNCFQLRSATIPDSGLQGGAWCHTISTDAGTSFTWTDSTTTAIPISLELDSIPIGNSVLLS